MAPWLPEALDCHIEFIRILVKGIGLLRTPTKERHKIPLKSIGFDREFVTRINCILSRSIEFDHMSAGSL